ncbi:MAG: NAD(P)-dependent oxidoreductase [Actinomycetota bacterium]|nr:NAD(P)-dependent oxidoreductase [Actinomycetota bacterium]
MTRVAFIGVGAMGGRMARRLLDAGHELTVWNRTPSKAMPLVDAGAARASTPAEAARGAEVVITMVADRAALEAVSERPEGIAAHAKTVVEMSTVGPAAVSGLRALLGPEAELLDAPVLGSVSEAEAGTLQIFVGGDEALFERIRPLLEELGSLVHVGPLGAGAAAKLVANLTLLGTLGLLGETLALADGLGLSREATWKVLDGTPLAGQAERRRPAVESGEYPLRFALALARKDADLVAEAAAAAGVEVPLASGARDWFADAEAAGWGQRDYSAVLARIIGPR